MARTIFTSLVLHCFMLALLFILSWTQAKPLPKKKIPPNVRIVYTTPKPTPTPRPVTPKPTPRVTEAVTPVPTKKPTPTPKPTPKKTATPKPKTPKPKPKKTATPKPKKTKRPTPTPTPRRTIPPDLKPITTITPKATPRKSTPRPTPRRTPRKTPPPQFQQQKGPVKMESSKLPDYYMIQARQRIEENFMIFQGRARQGITAEVEFTILKNGKITGIRLTKSTGDNSLDRLAISALEQTDTLMELPDSLRMNSLRVSITFNYEL